MATQDIQKRQETNDGRASLPAPTPEETDVQAKTKGEQIEKKPAPDPVAFKLRALYFGAGIIPTTGLLDYMTQGQFGESLVLGAIMGTTLAYFTPEIHNTLAPGIRLAGQLWDYVNRNHSGRAKHRLLDKEWWLYGLTSTPYAEQEDDQAQIEEGERLAVDGAEEDVEPETEPLSEVDPLFQTQPDTSTGGIARLTIEQIVKNTTPNSYQIWIGRSMTTPGNRAVRINFYKQHFRYIGASQRGKSSMVGAFLDIVTRTHSPKYVRLILLDKENRTSKLFAHLPHVLTMRKEDGESVKLHARNEDQVLDYLMHTVMILKHREQMSVAKIQSLPIILVYIEEFLAVKNTFKARGYQAKTDDERKQAESDYKTFVYCINQLSQLGLKYRVQLLLCAQVEYADDDFKEAMVNIGCGFSFCVEPTAAAASGFVNRKLLNQNAAANKVGQAVVETPDCTDIILAPDFDLERRVLELEASQYEDDDASLVLPVRPASEPAHSDSDTRTATPGEPNLTLIRADADQDEYAQKNGVRQPVDTTHTTQNDAYPKLNGTQITIFTQAYEMTGNIDKSLSFAKADTRYREHARVIIRELGLKKREA